MKSRLAHPKDDPGVPGRRQVSALAALVACVLLAAAACAESDSTSQSSSQGVSTTSTTGALSTSASTTTVVQTTLTTLVAGEREGAALTRKMLGMDRRTAFEICDEIGLLYENQQQHGGSAPEGEQAIRKMAESGMSPSVSDATTVVSYTAILRYFPQIALTVEKNRAFLNEVCEPIGYLNPAGGG